MFIPEIVCGIILGAVGATALLIGISMAYAHAKNKH